MLNPTKQRVVMSKKENFLTVADMKAVLDELPDDMPLFHIDGYLGVCEPLRAALLPSTTTISELEFLDGTRAWFENDDITSSLQEHWVIRVMKVLPV